MIDLPDLAATEAFAAALAPLLRRGDVVALAGDLGAGKTALARAVIRARAGSSIEVPSPTFTLLQTYPLPGLALAHADLYRIEDPDEMAEIGLEAAWEEGCLLVEWPERGAGYLPADRLDLRLEEVAGDLDARRLRVEAGPIWAGRLSLLTRFGAIP